MRYFLGVDGGQSSTTALVGDDTGRVAGVGIGGPCNHVAAAEAAAKLARVVNECVSKATAGLGDVQFTAACFGMSGGPADKQAILERIIPTDRLVVTNDAVIALTGGTAGAPGIITIAGTGSIALGRNAAGKIARSGGWGYVFGDEGGGFDIARQALRAALRNEEGWGPYTALREAVLEATGAPNINDAMHLFYTPEWPRSRVAKLARQVDECAAAGDHEANNILNGAAQQLALIAAGVRGQLWQPGAPVKVVYIGGVFRSDRLRERFRTLVELTDNVTCIAPIYSPAAGALLEAYLSAGLTPKLSNLPETKQ